ncbi:methyl-accepting chemotaxis protein [Bowmanella sp. JS7-9]|uniref:Methyl-accepting chemotaxis protein n=1 Tax=Pseudobowmanella zhangzhouensis TaxID=1537679 RepID=A0ABW1XI60_9ALTE|nr:methyl-accepting chemotaxis protein [Bowmanella sp. JS7-9]TBX25761.1 hypothetical protein TK45_03490 [Bowmanella sp. JS7-9]
MFVSKSRFEQLEKQLEATKKQLATESGEKNAALEHISELEQKLSQLKAPDMRRMLVDSLLTSLNQIEAIRSATQQGYEHLQREAADIDTVNQTFSKSASSLSRITSGIQGVTADMQGMSVSISSLKDIADSIYTFVNTISKISDQTNLLALNAAIEAARAGEAGRGFSVVADEVRALATNTNESAEEVGGLVQKIKVGTDTSVASVNSLQEANAELSQGIEELGQTYKAVSSAFGNMQALISGSVNQGFVDLVKLDHVVWKAKVYETALGKNNMRPEEFTSHSDCRLGRWCHGEGKTKFGSNNAFKKLDEPHKQVHQQGIDGLRAAANGDFHAAVQHFTRMEQASDEVMRLLSSL